MRAINNYNPHYIIISNPDIEITDNDNINDLDKLYIPSF